MNDVIVYCQGPLSCSVCAPKNMPPEEVEKHTAEIIGLKVLGELNGAGMKVSPLMKKALDTQRWWVSGDKTFKTGEPMPCQCEKDLDRQH